MNEHFAIWSVIFAVGLGGLYAGLKVAWPQLTLAKYHVYAGPSLLILFWLYGTIFIPVAYWLTWLSAREDTHARR